MRNKSIVIGCIVLLASGSIFGSEPAPTLGAIAERLIVGGDMITRLMHFVSVVVGIILFVMAGSLYKAHRFNPKFSPLERPIIYAILGIVLVMIPFLGKIFGPMTGSTRDLEKKEVMKKGVQTHDIDAPLNWGNDYDH